MAAKRNLITAAILSSWMTGTAMADAHYKSMPPVFSLNENSTEVLRNYPLGVISEQDAFAHHGAPIRKIVLPNGNVGWLYKIGEKLHVPNIYVLEFSKEGLVTNVLHKNYRYRIGHSALQYQYLENADVMTRSLGPAPTD